MSTTVKMQIQVVYSTKEIRLVFAELTREVGMDVDTAERMIKMLEEKVRDLKGKVIVHG